MLTLPRSFLPSSRPFPPHFVTNITSLLSNLFELVDVLVVNISLAYIFVLLRSPFVSGFPALCKGEAVDVTTKRGSAAGIPFHVLLSIIGWSLLPTLFGNRPQIKSKLISTNSSPPSYLPFPIGLHHQNLNRRHEQVVNDQPISPSCLHSHGVENSSHAEVETTQFHGVGGRHAGP